MPFQFSFKSSKQSAYDLAARTAGQPGEHKSEAEDVATGDGNSIQGISIAPHEQFSYIPNMNTTKSLATDIIQLTQFKKRRPTIQLEQPQRKPSFRNIFLGVPDPGARRFSQDIRGATLAAKCQALENKETKRVLILQVFVPFLLSGFGNVGAGLFLNWAQTWLVFREDTIFYALLATFMAFKTNLEATLAARLSTCSNMGSMKGVSKKLEAFFGNLAMVQTQSIIFGFMASVFVLVISYIELEGEVETILALRVIATSMASICINEIVSSVLILAFVVGSEKAGVNPDNVSTLIAAMLGDFSSIFFVSLTAAAFHTIQTLEWVFFAVIIGLACILPLTLYVATQNSFTKGMFLGTHLPLTLAVTVATVSGLVFDHAVQSFARIAMYQAVVNGLSVNLMAVQASRISTYLAQLNAVAPERAKEFASNCSPFKALYGQGKWWQQ